VKTIKINVPLDHSKGVTVETEGFSGPACQAATKAIEEALGTTSHDETTEEFMKPLDQDDHQLQ
jgi:hypothetical protein